MSGARARICIAAFARERASASNRDRAFASSCAVAFEGNACAIHVNVVARDVARENGLQNRAIARAPPRDHVARGMLRLAAREGRRREMKVLIVEDDPDVREMLVEIFLAYDWDVLAVAETALALATLRRDSVDLVISDENLEGASGSAMLEEASSAGLLFNVGAMIYTAEPRELHVPEGVRVLQKPLGVSSILDEANAVIARSARSSRPSRSRMRELREEDSESPPSSA